MESGHHPSKRPYIRPALVVYGDLQTLTRTVAINKNKNDSLQGQNNLKT